MPSNNLSYFSPLPLIAQLCHGWSSNRSGFLRRPWLHILSCAHPHSIQTLRTRVLWSPLRVTAEPQSLYLRKRKGIPSDSSHYLVPGLCGHIPHGEIPAHQPPAIVCVRHVSEGFLEGWKSTPTLGNNFMFHEQVRASTSSCPCGRAWARIS